ncbi:MAG: glycosyltransferase [Acidimicrobiales bacterium]
MRVLMVSKLWPPRAVGGAERYAHRLAAHLEAAGHEVGVVTYGVEGDGVVAAVPTHGVDPERWWTASAFVRRRSHVVDLWNPSARRVLGRAIEEFRPDVVHSHAVAGMSVAALLTDAPRVHTVHDLWLTCWRGYPIRDGEVCSSTCAVCLPYLWSRRSLVQRRPPVFVTPADAVRRAHADKGWDTTSWRVIRHALDLPAEQAPRRRPDPAALRVGFIGQVSREKGVDLLLDAVPVLPPSTRVVVAGDGVLDEQVRGHPQVEHRGRVGGDEKERFFADIDVLVVPSRVPEVAPLVLDEAAVRGVPIIGARRGGIPEYVPAPCQPLLFDPDRPADLGASLQRFASDPDRFVVEPPVDRTWSDHVSQILAAYGDAVGAAQVMVGRRSRGRALRAR